MLNNLCRFSEQHIILESPCLLDNENDLAKHLSTLTDGRLTELLRTAMTTYNPDFDGVVERTKESVSTHTGTGSIPRSWTAFFFE